MPDTFILADNKFTASTAIVTDSGAVTNGARMRDYRDDEQSSHALAAAWTTSVDLGATGAAKAQAVAVLNNNLSSLGITVTLTVDSSPDGAAWTNRFTGVVTAKDFYGQWTDATTHRYYRYVFTPSAPPASPGLVGEVLVGDPIVFTQPVEWQGFDPSGETPVAYIEESKLPTAPHTVAYAERVIVARWNLLDEAFLEARGTLAAFRTWWEEQGSKGVPFVFVWANTAGEMFRLLWCWAKGSAPRRFIHPPEVIASVASSYRSLSLTMVGRKRS